MRGVRRGGRVEMRVRVGRRVEGEGRGGTGEKRKCGK